jgi:dTDP-glucose pyrophosphorylase
MLHYEMHDHGTTSIPVDEPTEGPACTVLLAAELIDSDEPLLIANCDQLVEGEWAMLGDGVILVFDEPDRDPRWSYVHVGADGWVDLVAEKDPISTLATCGIYGFRRGRDFVAAARAMIAADERVGGEFYVAPVYNRLIADGAKIAAHRVDSMIDMGTPEALERSLDAVR